MKAESEILDYLRVEHFPHMTCLKLNVDNGKKTNEMHVSQRIVES